VEIDAAQLILKQSVSPESEFQNTLLPLAANDLGST
jgi:hypothetical protein